MKRVFTVAIILFFTVGLFYTCARADCTPSRESAIKWLREQEGVWYDLDGKYGAQCSDFASAYMNWLYSGATNPYQGYGVYNASYYPTVASWNTSRWTIFSDISNVTPEPGDIYVQSSHIGVYLSGSKTNAEVIDQNSWETWALAQQYGDQGRAARIYRTDISNATHFIRYNYFSVVGTLDVNGLLDGSNSGTISGFGTFDIRVGSTTLTGQSDYYNNSVPAGTTYTISNIKAATGKIYSGVTSGSLSGTVQAGGSLDVRLKFDTCTNHTYGNGVVTQNATCTQTGVMTYTCTKCNATKTETIPMLAHRPVVDPAVPATITSTGLTEGSHCAECGTVLVPQIVTDKLPRVARDFDLDGEAETVLVLPEALKTIEAEAFAGSPAEAVMIPDGVTTIGSRAFADMPNLIAVFMPESVRTVAFDLFEDSPNVTLYVRKGSRLGVRLDLPYVEIDDGWVSEDEVPNGAAIIDEKWTYTQTTTETTTSTASTLDGWEQTGFTWQKTGEGTRTYADYPAGFDAGHALYSKYEKGALTTTTSGNTKREAGASSLVSYIYWHWTHNKYERANGNYNIFIDDHYGWDDQGREYYNFRAFESNESYSHTDPNGTNGGDCYYWWGGNPEDGSWWWFRFDVRRQTYTDYQKLFSYQKTTVTEEESASPVSEGDGVSDVRHWVKYGF